MKENYRDKVWFSLNNLADFMAEFYNDEHGCAWQFWAWLDKKCEPKPKKKKRKT